MVLEVVPLRHVQMSGLRHLPAATTATAAATAATSQATEELRVEGGW